MFIRMISIILKYQLRPRGGGEGRTTVSFNIALFAGKLRHNSGNDILEGNRDMLKEQGTR